MSAGCRTGHIQNFSQKIKINRRKFSSTSLPFALSSQHKWRGETEKERDNCLNPSIRWVVTKITPSLSRLFLAEELTLWFSHFSRSKLEGIPSATSRIRVTERLEKKSPKFWKFSQNCSQNIKSLVESSKQLHPTVLECQNKYKKRVLELLI